MPNASRFDKADPYSGTFRAKANAAIVAANAGKIYAVTINGSGRFVIGGTLAEIIGVVVPTEAVAAGIPLDVMYNGEIAQAEATTAQTTLTAGALVYAHADGTVDNVSASGKIIGRCVEAGRLRVFVTPAIGA